MSPPRSSPWFLTTLVFIAVFVFEHALAQTGCSGVTNSKSIIDAAPKFISQVANGKRYLAGQGSSSVHVIHVYGTPYAMGYAQGALLKAEIQEMISTYFSYLESMIDQYIKVLPKDVADFIIKWGLDAALDLTWLATRDYTPDRFKDEIRGLAEGASVSEKDVIRLNMLPELIKAGCSMFGAWGNATREQGGSLFQLRALDWDKNAPIKKWPTIVIYHPDDGFTFANIGWPAFVGSITGYSSSPIGISEKVWLTDSSIDSRIGKPWNYALRDILQYADELDTALTMLANTHRTCSIHVGVGSGRTGTFAGVEYSYKELNIYDDINQPAYVPGHPHIQNVVYWDKHKQPSSNPCLASLLQKYFGQLNADNTVHNIVSISETGDTQIAVYDFQNNFVYVAYAGLDGQGPIEAYSRTFVKFDMSSLFAEPPPSL